MSSHHRIPTSHIARGALVSAAVSASLLIGPVAASQASPVKQHTAAGTSAAVKAAATTRCTNLPTLKQGSRGYYVVRLQRLLNSWVYDTTPPRTAPNHMHKIATDGVFGAATKKQVKLFQAWPELRGKIAADGVVGPATWAKLTSYGCIL